MAGMQPDLCSPSCISRLLAAPLSRRHFMKKFPLLFPALRLLSKFVHLIRQAVCDVALCPTQAALVQAGSCFLLLLQP